MGNPSQLSIFFTKIWSTLPSVLRSLLVIVILILPFGQLLRLPSTSPEVAIHFLDVVVVLIALIYLISQLKFPLRFHISLQLLAIIIFGVSAIISWIVNFVSIIHYSQLLIGLFYLIRLFAYFSIAFCTYSVSTKSNHRRDILQALLLAACLFTLTGLVQYLFLPDLRFLYYFQWDDHLFRLASTFLDPGFAGLILGYFIIFLLPLRSSIRPKKFYFIFMLLLIISLALTFSRASYLSLLAGLVITTLQTKKWLPSFLIIICLFAVVSLSPRPTGEGVNLARTSTVNFRLQNYQNSLKIYQDHPIWGVGYNRYRQVQLEYGFLDSRNWQVSHAGAGADNSALFLLATFGIVGSLAFLFLVITVCLPLINAPMVFVESTFLLSIERNLPTITLSTLAILFVHGMFENSWFYTPTLLWLMILIGLTFRVRKSRSS